MALNKNQSAVFNAILGDKRSISLENRAVSSICFVSAILFLNGFFVTLFIGAPRLFSLVYIALTLIYFFFYTLSRVKKIYLLTIYLMMPVCLAYIAFLWFFDGGISGSASLISLLIVILVSPIPDKKRRYILLALIIVMQGALYLIQYNCPDLVQAYQSLEDQFTAHFISFIGVSLITAFLVNFIFRTLDRERALANRARKQLKESEYLFRTLSETTSTAIVLHQDGKFTHANPAARKLYGYSLGELKMMRFRQLISPEDRDRIYGDDESADAVIKPVYGDEIRILPRSGKETPVYLEASPIEYYGRPAGLVSMIDLTRLREAETNLFNLQKYLSDIINSMPSIIVGVDKNMCITQWNRHAEKQTGISEQAALYANIFNTIPRLEAEKENILNAVAEQQLLENRRYSYDDTEQTRFEEITVYPLKESGSDGAVIRLDDVTEKARMEELVIQSEKMISTGGLAAGMAHEINNPLAGILQNSQLARNRLMENLPANIRSAEAAGTSMPAIRQFMEERRVPELLNNINTAGARAAKIVDNMLSFAKKGTPKQNHDLAVLLSKSIELAKSDYNLKNQYDFKNIKIIKEFDADVPEVYCEENKIMQVFFNILSNAAHALKNQERPVENPTLILRISNAGRMAQVEMEDNGPGISEDIKKRVFEPFFTTQDISQGTGLGLSLSYFIVVKDHKGEMEMESGPGKGANFIIRLPFR